MSNSTTQLDLISSSQAQKEVTANALFDAASPAMTYARRGSTTAALTWGFYGGTVLVAGVPTQIANGTVALTASATNYVEADPATGAVSANTIGFTAGRLPLYQVVAGAGTVTSYTDLRILGGGAAGVSADDLADAVADGIAGHLAAIDPHAQYQRESEKGAANGYAGLGGDGKVPAAQLPASATAGGTVTSVALTTPGLLFDVSGSPVTSSGTLAISLKTQAANKFLAGPTSGTDAVPTMRTLVAADMAAILAAANVFTKNQSVAPVSLGSGVSPAIDASLSNNFKITLGANNTLVNPTNLTEGMVLNFAITQDATGSRTLAYGSLYKFPGGTVPTLSTTANAKDFMSCYYDGSVLLCQMNKGFA